MKIVVIGGTGLIGSKLVQKLEALGHEAVPASPNSGVNTLTGEGLAQVLEGTQVVVDVSNSPSFADDAVMNFFQIGSRTRITQLRREHTHRRRTRASARRNAGRRRRLEFTVVCGRCSDELLSDRKPYPHHPTQA